VVNIVITTDVNHHPVDRSSGELCNLQKLKPEIGGTECKKMTRGDVHTHIPEGTGRDGAGEKNLDACAGI